MPPRRRATYEDIIALPEHVTGEIIDGELYTATRPAGPQTTVASVLGMDLGNPFARGRGGPGGWILLHEPELHFGEDVLVPDLAGWRVERLSAEERQQAYFTTPPDWVCEVASPSRATYDRAVKAPRYAAHRVSYLWLVEPVEERVEAFERADARWLWLGTFCDEAAAAIAPFDAVPLDLAQVWSAKGLRTTGS